MRLVVRKLEIPDLGQLQSLVIEHLDGIEPGLTVLDSRLLLGHATVDIVALDTEGALVLVTAGFTADEDMLLKAVEAYSWCLEYPDAIRRLYPSVEVSSTRPPRLMFIVERLPDAFHRKIKQLGFSEVDCVEFRHLDVSGTPAVYFDTLARLRRGSPHAEFQPAPIARRVSDAQIRRASEPVVTEQPLNTSIDHSDNVVPLVTGPSSARTTTVRLQKMLNTNGHGNGGAPVIDIATRTAPSLPRIEMPAPSADVAAPSVGAVRSEAAAARPVETPRIEMPALEIQLPQVETETAQEEPVELAQDAIAAARADEASSFDIAASVAETAEPELESSASEPEPTVLQTPEPRISFAEIANELLGALAGAAATTSAPAAAASIPAEVPEDNRGELNAEANAPAVTDEQPVAASARKPVFPAPKSVASAAKPVAPVIKPVAPATKPIAPAPKPIAPAPKPAAASKAVAAPKAVAATPRPAPAAPKPAAAEAAPAASETPSQALPQEFEGLKFPNDGVLTRQWMEFLNQMASSK